MVQNNQLQEDEIDLRELFKTIWNYKKFIFIFTLTVTFCALIYLLLKSPIYEARALFEIGSYKLNNSKISVENSLHLQKKLSTIFIDMRKDDLKDKFKITKINILPKINDFLEIRSESNTNKKAIEGIKEVLFYTQLEHKNILNDVKKNQLEKIQNINKQIADIKYKQIKLIDAQIKLQKENSKSLKSELREISKNLKHIESSNPSLAALKLMERKDIDSSIKGIESKILSYEYKKNELLTNGIYKLEEAERSLKRTLLPYNYRNTSIVGKIITKEYPIKPKKKIIVTVAFVTGFILSIFLVFFIEFIKGIRKEEKIK